MIFQDPLTALNPAIPVGTQIFDSLRTHQPQLGRRGATARVEELLNLVGIPASEGTHAGLCQRTQRRHAAARHDRAGGRERPEAADRRRADDRARRHGAGPDHCHARPHPARARARDPVHQPQSRPRRRDLRPRLRHVCRPRRRSRPMWSRLFAAPRHPYTRQLLRCIPRLSDSTGPMPTIPGLPPRIGQLPPGCSFAPRCDQALEQCGTGRPPVWRDHGHMAVCWRSGR